MAKLEQFLRTVLSSLNPRTYNKLSKAQLKDSWKYFFTLFFLTMIVMCLLAIPNMIKLPAYLREQLTSFNSLDIDVQQEMNRPFLLPQQNPLIMIDTTDMENERKAKVLITEDSITYKFLPFTEPKSLDVGEGRLLEQKQEFAIMATALILLLLPGILLLLAVALLAKYILLIFLSGVIGFLLVGFIHFHIRLKQLFNVAIYASTLMIIIELLTKPFLTSNFFIHYIAYGVYFILGTIRAGYFDAQKEDR